MEYGPTTGFAAAAAFTLKIVKEYLERSKTEGASMEEGTFMARLMKIHQEKPETMSEIDALNVCLGNVSRQRYDEYHTDLGILGPAAKFRGVRQGELCPQYWQKGESWLMGIYIIAPR